MDAERMNWILRPSEIERFVLQWSLSKNPTTKLSFACIYFEAAYALKFSQKLLWVLQSQDRLEKPSVLSAYWVILISSWPTLRPLIEVALACEKLIHFSGLGRIERAQKLLEGAGKGGEEKETLAEKLLDFENSRSHTNGVSDWRGSEFWLAPLSPSCLNNVFPVASEWIRESNLLSVDWFSLLARWNRSPCSLNGGEIFFSRNVTYSCHLRLDLLLLNSVWVSSPRRDGWTRERRIDCVGDVHSKYN